MVKENILAKYRDIVTKDSLKARNLIKKLDYKEDYYLLKCIAQTYLDESRFEDGDGSNLRARWDRRKWRMAERYIIKAFAINSDSAEVLYTMGEIRHLSGLNDIAIYCFESIIKMKIKDIAFGEYGRGAAFARELINDAKFELYRLYYYENATLSKRYLSMYKTGLKKGIPTIFKPLKRFLLD